MRDLIATERRFVRQIALVARRLAPLCPPEPASPLASPISTADSALSAAVAHATLPAASVPPPSSAVNISAATSAASDARPAPASATAATPSSAGAASASARSLPRDDSLQPLMAAVRNLQFFHEALLCRLLCASDHTRQSAAWRVISAELASTAPPGAPLQLDAPPVPANVHLVGRLAGAKGRPTSP